MRPLTAAASTARQNAATPAPVTTPDDQPSAQPLADLITKSLDDDKAENIVSIDLSGKSSVADIMIIASGRSHRHVNALTDHIVQDMKEAGFTTPRIEGVPACDWVLIDAGDVVVHIFRPEVREFYNLEKMWMVDPVPAKDAH